MIRPAPCVSVIIPTYNRAALLPHAVDSVLAQSFEDFEIIIVDDGSPDDTKDVVARRYGENPRIQYHAQENKKIAAARNQGVRLARGEFLAFLDDDDLWHPEKLALQVKAMESDPEAAMCITDTRIVGFNEGGESFSKHVGFDGRLTMEAILRRTLFSISTVMLRRALFEDSDPFDVKMSCCEDWDFNIRMVAHHKIIYLERILADYVYRAELSQMTDDLLKINRYKLRALEKNRSLFLKAGISPRVLEERSCRPARFVSRALCLDGRCVEARPFLKTWRRARPLRVTPFRLLLRAWFMKFFSAKHRREQEDM